MRELAVRPVVALAESEEERAIFEFVQSARLLDVERDNILRVLMLCRGSVVLTMRPGVAQATGSSEEAALSYTTR